MDRAYSAANVARGRLPGQLRIRIRNQRIVGPWIDWLQLSPGKLRAQLEPTRWRISKTVGGAACVAILEGRPDAKALT
jgi:hypothetical protein